MLVVHANTPMVVVLLLRQENFSTICNKLVNDAVDFTWWHNQQQQVRNLRRSVVYVNLVLLIEIGQNKLQLRFSMVIEQVESTVFLSDP